MVAILIPVPDLFLEAASHNLQFPDGNQPIGNILKEPRDRHRSVVLTGGKNAFIQGLHGDYIVIF